MPTPDASQFIQFKKYQAIDSRRAIYSPKQITHLYTHISVTALSNNTNVEFLPSFTNKVTSPFKRFPINYNTAPKSKIPGVGTRF